ncbi:MAG: class I SAM-dependent methyltransferase [Candidatus Heimdallarchaeota archaeon]|nr:class I SAM-dependent methyltransferase [Candidatus Heimdallarchaeota archaeon]MCG3255468.1 class I SAM-dependent methyltransferase [Candidatus Heimdallarchaeota archaeon]MCK4610542.1 class I SAM-dependent methyltransferase [Candidatus Heimdallarchaeota archaeon]
MNDFVSNKVKKAKLISFFIYKYHSNLFRKNIINNSSIKNVFSNKSEQLSYLNESEVINLVKDLSEKRKKFRKNPKERTNIWNSYRWGAINLNIGKGVYSLIRKFKPEVLVETGVCNGISSAFILLALHKNKKGRLYSIDYPKIKGVSYKNGTFWQDKGGAEIPKGKKPGWVIPKNLRDRWTLIQGKSQEELPPLISELKEIDFFLHDSDHSYDCMMFEYEEVFNVLKTKGILISDDIVWNNSFDDFCKKTNKKPYYISPNVGFLIK